MAAPHPTTTPRPEPGRQPRPAGPSDVPALAALVQSAYRGDASRAGWTTEADLLGGRRTDAAELTRLVADPASVVLVLDDPGSPDGELLACCHLERRGGDDDPHAYFGLFAVRPVRQGAGTGKALLAAAEREAVVRWGVPRVEMTVLAQRAELLAFYRRRGYRETGEVRPFPYGEERFGLPRRDDLALVVLTRPVPDPEDGGERTPRGGPQPS